MKEISANKSNYDKSNLILDEKLELINLNLRNNGIYGLSKSELENILSNESEFDTFVVELVKEILENWDFHAENIRKVSDMLSFDISEILEKFENGKNI